MDPSRNSQIWTAIQHISESVFVGLCRKFGTTQLVVLKRDVMDIWSLVMSTKEKLVSSMWSGSRKEAINLECSDIDFMFWLNNHHVIWELSQSQYYNTQRQTLILCDCSDSPPGFTLLYLLSPSINTVVQSACVRMNNRYYISSSKFRQIDCFTPPTQHPTQHGPCISGTYHGLVEYDQALCFVCDFWPPSASSWIARCHSWPQPYVVNAIVKGGCHFVAIGHKLGSHEDHEWRISFSLAEQKLVYSMNHCQFLTYGLLKLFLTEIINNGAGDADKLLCSYHMKTAIFWVIQQNTIPHWRPQNLLECFWVCFKLILKWVYEGVCPNFFIPDNNMFLCKIHGENQYQLFIRLYGLYRRGLAFLLQSPSIRSYIMIVIHNPRISICTDEHTLISEKEFDKRICYMMCNFSMYIESNIQSCMKYQHIIERLIVSSLLTQYQVLLLQKLTASVLQGTALLLHMEIHSHKNKLSYRSVKISCRMLKLAAKFGCITDMMYLAMYYYKTLRYREALSIIEIIKVKLAQPYVMYMDYVGADMYTEVLGGQSWSTKMRQAVAWHIILKYEFHYISELIPEQESAHQNDFSVLIVPPFILVYMLEILCFRHVDIMRVQTALDNLQTLVHCDQGQYIPLHLRDISWQILGICQQVTGNLLAALYSYLRTLREVPFNKIQTATYMRIEQVGFLL